MITGRSSIAVPPFSLGAAFCSSASPPRVRNVLSFNVFNQYCLVPETGPMRETEMRLPEYHGYLARALARL
jgi:hypothetical protein